MNNLLFIAKYPEGVELRDGMAQRIAAIDNEFKDYKRDYLYLSEDSKKRVIRLNDKVTLYSLNPFIHSRLIKGLIRHSEFQYIHSLYNALRLLPYYKYCRNLILDAHGIVPEETILQGKKIKAIIYNFIETRIFKYLKSVITVSEAMTRHFRLKHPNSRINNYISKTIYPSNVFFKLEDDKLSALRKELRIKEDDVVIIYSGNTQKWQNIDLMLECISKMDNPKYYFIILTQNVEEFHQRIEPLKDRRIYLNSVNPSELGYYYSLSNYGFVLRDDIAVNRVAAPTKIIEYLNYGIIPIVKSEKIGDWAALGYEYFSVESDLCNLKNNKSIKNKELALYAFEKNNNVDLKLLIKD